MSKIYSQNAFDHQPNGTVFYKEGKVDDLPGVTKGTFESWKYNFDAGKQVFRAEDSDGNGAIYEKRLVKDINGIPKWTGWMEIPNAEANGIQAIAINDEPLRLPNADGAIKLQITPDSINSFSKQEIYDLIQQKIQDNNEKVYTYVSWCKDPETNDWAESAYRVLEITFPDGGVVEKFYLVESKPGTEGVQEDATYFIWDIKQTPTPHDDWIQINAPDMRAFVSYTVFNEHAQDRKQHFTEEEKAEIISNISLNETNILETSESLTKHIEDINTPMSPHITSEERNMWNSYGAYKDLPNDGTRYIIFNGDYIPSYEQVGTDGAISNTKVLDKAWSAKNESILKENILDDFNAILNTDSEILKVQIEFSNINTSQTQCWFETDTGIKSPKYFTQMGVQFWTLDTLTPFNTITLKTDDFNKTISFNNIKLFITSRQLTSVNIGSPTLSMNLIGPEDKEPMYNGKPLSDIISAPNIFWTNIKGDPSSNLELNLKLADLLKDKINAADKNSNLRYDVFRESLTPSLIQQPGSEEFNEVIAIDNIANISNGTVIIDNIKEKIITLQENGSVPLSAKLEIKFVASADNAIYFETDNPLITASPTVTSSAFTWAWPGTIFNIFDKIILRCPNEYKVNYLEKVRLTISGIKFGDIEAGDLDKNWKQFAKDFELNAEKISLAIAKEYGLIDNNNEIFVYGQEIDNRYAGKEVTDSRFETINAKLNVENTERLEGDKNINNRIDNTITELKEYTNTSIESALEPVNNKITFIEENYYTEEKTDLALNNYTYDKPTIDEMIAIATEQTFDLIISSDEELKEAILDSRFENAMSILFRRNKNQNNIYTYTVDPTNTTAKLNLSKIRFIKGEEPVDVILNNLSCVENSNNQLIVESITIKFKEWGSSGYKYLNSKSSQVKEFDINNENMIISLDKYFNIYKLNLNVDSTLYFENLDSGRNYTLFIDQGDERKKLCITNRIHNYSSQKEFSVLDYIDNARENSRTIIHLIGTEESEKNGFIINEVIPGVSTKLEYETSIILGNIQGQIRNSTQKVNAVSVNGGFATGQIIATFSNGEDVKIKANFIDGDGNITNCTGWKDHGLETWKLIDSTNTVLASGTLDKLDGRTSIYTIPENGSNGDLILDFEVDHQLVAISLSDVAKNANMESKIQKRVGFYDGPDGIKNLYQAFFEEVEIEIIMKDQNPNGWFVHKADTNIGMLLNGGYIWNFYIKTLVGDKVENYDSVVLTPHIYKMVYDTTAWVVGSSSGIDYTTNVISGPQGNKIKFKDIVTGSSDDQIDPIIITGYNDGIRFELNKSGDPSYDGILYITDPEILNHYYEIDIIMNSKMKKKWNVAIVDPSNMTIDCDKEDSYSSGAIEIYKVGKNPLENSTRNVNLFVKWNNLHSIGKGIWTMEGDTNIAEVKQDIIPTETNSDKTTLVIKEKGIITAVFTSLDGVIIKQQIEVHVHVESVEIVQDAEEMKTNSSFSLKWYDRNISDTNKKLCAPRLTNVSGVWTVLSGQEYINIIGEKASTVGRLEAIQPVPKEGIPITISFTSNDTIYNKGLPATATYSVLVKRGIYTLKLQGLETELNYIGGSIEYPYHVEYDPNRGFLRLLADEKYTLRLLFKEGYTASNETINELALKLGATLKGDAVSGSAVFEFTMPYKDEVIKVSSKIKE